MKFFAAGLHHVLDLGEFDVYSLSDLKGQSGWNATAVCRVNIALSQSYADLMRLFPINMLG